MPFKSDQISSRLLQHIEEKIETAASRRKEESMKKVYDRIVDMRGNLITVIAHGVSLGELARIA